MTQETIWRPHAPFRQYKRTDESVRADGFKAGLEWPPHWDHVPGGPYVSRSEVSDHPDWKAHCAVLARHHKLWLEGWYEGFAENAKRNPKIRRLRDRLLMNKLAA